MTEVYSHSKPPTQTPKNAPERPEEGDGLLRGLLPHGGPKRLEEEDARGAGRQDLREPGHGVVGHEVEQRQRDEGAEGVAVDGDGLLVCFCSGGKGGGWHGRYVARTGGRGPFPNTHPSTRHKDPPSTTRLDERERRPAHRSATQTNHTYTYTYTCIHTHTKTKTRAFYLDERERRGEVAEAGPQEHGDERREAVDDGGAGHHGGEVVGPGSFSFV